MRVVTRRIERDMVLCTCRVKQNQIKNPLLYLRLAFEIRNGKVPYGEEEGRFNEVDDQYSENKRGTMQSLSTTPKTHTIFDCQGTCVNMILMLELI